MILKIQPLAFSLLLTIGHTVQSCQASELNLGDAQEKQTSVMSAFNDVTSSDDKGMLCFPWDPNTSGTMLNLPSNKQLKTGAIVLDGSQGSMEELFAPVYKPLAYDEHSINGFMTPRFLLNEDCNVPGMNIQSMRIVCDTDTKHNLDNELSITQCLFRGKARSVHFVCPFMNFKNVFIDGESVNTTFTLSPPVELNSFIEYIQITPKKCPVYFEGVIDFKNSTIENFVATHSDIALKVKM